MAFSWFYREKELNFGMTTIYWQFHSYKQQHQAFVQHATQQIALIESQKQALEQQASQKVTQNQIPPLMPPGVDLKPINNQNYSNNSMNNGSSIGPGNSLIANRNDRAPGPPPLMSQQVSMPGMNNMPAQSPTMNTYNNNGNSSNSNLDLSNFTVTCCDILQAHKHTVIMVYLG